MNYNDLICEKINSMISLYIEKKLMPAQVEFIEEHLKNCESCRKKYEYLKQLITTIKTSYENKEKFINQEKNLSQIKEYEYYKQDLSSYIDNELSFDESVKFKKYIMKVPLARKDLQNAYDMRQLLLKNWELNKKKLNTDFSKTIIGNIFHAHKYHHQMISGKIAAIIISISILISGVSFYYYAKQNDFFKSPSKEKIANIKS